MRKSPLIHTNVSNLNYWVIRLNQGYLSFLIISMLLILLASGWKDILAKGVSHRSILFFFVSWIVLSFMHISTDGITVSFELPFLVGTACAGLWALRQPVVRVHVITAGLLIGMFDFLLLELNGYLPWFLTYNSVTDMAIFAAAFALMTGFQAVQQFISLSLGLTSAELLHQLPQHAKGMPVHLGGAGFQDHWWLIFGLTRLCSVGFEYGYKYTVRTAKLWLDRRKEWRK